MNSKTGKNTTAASEARGRPLADQVLELMWRERKISRAEIARRTGLSRSTVSDIVTSLLATKLIAEVGDGPSRGGRRPVLLQFQDQAFVILGVDMGATHVSAVLTDLRGRTLATAYADHDVRSDPAGSLDLMDELCDACLEQWGAPAHPLLGIGVAVPSPVDPRSPNRLSNAVLPAWRDVSLTARLEATYGVPVLVDNDANLGAVAEQWWGGGQGVQDLTYIKVGFGIGAGYIIRGELYRGATGVAGEIGHVAIDAEGPPCVCGNRGCLTTFVGAEALTARARELSADYPGSVLASADVTIAAIEDAALADDPLGLRIVGEAAERIGIALASMLNLMNPAAVILGGGLSRVGERLLVPIREAVLRRTLVSSVAASQIQTSDLGPQAIAIGAATHVLDSALKDPQLFSRATPS